MQFEGMKHWLCIGVFPVEDGHCKARKEQDVRRETDFDFSSNAVLSSFPLRVSVNSKRELRKTD